MKHEKKQVWRPFFKFYSRFQIPWWLYILSLICGIAYAEVTMWIASYLIRVNKGELYNSVIVGYVFLTVGNSIISFAQNIFSGYGNQKIILRARKLLWNQILHMPLPEIEKNKPSSLISAVVNDVSQASTTITMIFLFGSSSYGFIRACTTLYLYNSKLTLYLLLVIPLAILVFFIVGKLQFIMMRKKYASLNSMTEYFSEHLSSAKHVKAQAMEEKEIKDGFDVINKRYRADVYYAIMSTVQTMINSIYTTLCTIVMCVGGSNLILNGRMESTGINTFSTYMEKVNQYLAEILTQYQSIKGTQGVLARVNVLLDIPKEVPEKGELWKETSQKDIIFEHVSFAYREDNAVIHDVSLRIPFGKTTAIIGDNGSGKSTLMKLIQGLYIPQDGKIYVAGNEVSSIKLSQIRKKFGYILQHNPLFSGTIRENITYGVDFLVSEEELKYIGKLACLDEFVNDLPYGYDTQIGEAGSQLSGGQRQRVAIARVFLQKPEYLLMDEAGASLDHQSYSTIYHAIQNYMIDKTVVLIAHDMREIMDADHIIILNQGSVEAAGTHEELLKISLTYQQYITRQSASN